jgi:peptidoglycan hydrolase-like protein with peptidoglycan-binding domain
VTATKPLTRASVSQKSNQKSPPRRVPAPYYAQQQPTTDRYRQIQQALADRGYFQGAADGMWGAESVEALKRFQTAQNLDADGKIGALSLIALGLGPRRENASAKTPPLVAPAEHTAEPAPEAPPDIAPTPSLATP